MKKPKKRKTDFVSRVGRLSDMFVQHAELKANVAHEWKDKDAQGRAVISFNGRPYLAYEEDIK